MAQDQSWADQAIRTLEIEHPKQAEYAKRRRTWTQGYLAAAKSGTETAAE